MAEIDFFGEQIRLADEPGEWAMLEFAAAASRTDSGTIAGLAAVMDVLEASIHAGDWQRFKDIARKNRAQVERDLMPIVVGLFTGQTERPTQQPSGSSDGLRRIAPSSTGSSSSPVIDRHNAAGRPDLALITSRAQTARLAG